MADDNPFLAPQDEAEIDAPTPRSEDEELSGIRVDGDCLVVRDGAVLPPRCIKTNRPVEGRRRRKTLYWTPPWIYLLLLVHLLVLLIVYFLVRKRVRLEFSLSQEAAAAYRKRCLINWAVFVGSIGCFVMAGRVGGGPGSSMGMWLFMGGLGLLASLVLLVVWGGVVKVRRHIDGHFWIKGCGRPFLESLAR